MFSEVIPRALAWKKTALASGQHEYTDIKAERIERAIVDDVTFLAAHPTRRSNNEGMARRREFNDAMRQRIWDIAAARDLSDKLVLKLKHQEIARFSLTHGVSLAWLLEGSRSSRLPPWPLSPAPIQRRAFRVVRQAA